MYWDDKYSTQSVSSEVSGIESISCWILWLYMFLIVRTKLAGGKSNEGYPEQGLSYCVQLILVG